jgi:hypothetical protein
MLRDFAGFLWALWTQWRSLLTGGSTMALVALWGMIGGKPVAPHIDWFIVGLTLMLASFAAWRHEWIGIDEV